MEYLVPAGLWRFDEKRERSSELFRIGSIPIKILVVDTSRPINDVQEDNRFKYMSHLITIVMESQNTTLLVITYYLADPGLLLRRWLDTSSDHRFWHAGLTRASLTAT